MSTFRLHYHLQNNGDGSASVVFHSSKKEAEDAEEKDLEEGRDGWGESCVSFVDLKVEGDQIVRVEDEYVEETKKFKKVSFPLEKRKG